MFPEGMILVPVTGTVEGVPDGLSVEARFTCDRWLVGPTDDAIVPPFTVVAQAQAGAFVAELPATNDPVWGPAWQYRVVLRYGNKKVTGSLTVPYDEPAGFDIADRLNLDQDPVPAGVAYMPLSLRGAPGGVPSLDEDGVVPLDQLPPLSASSAAWTDITGKPSTFPPSAHTHPIGDISDLQVQLDGKQPAGTYLVPADISNLISSETLTESLADKADLVGGVLASSQIPAIAVTDYRGASANQAAMLAKVGQKGDWTIRTDLGTAWIITGADPTVLGGWTELAYPASPVQSVAGKTGAVTLVKADVGLGNVDNTSDANKPVSTAQQAALNLKANTASLATVATSGDYNDLLNKPAGGSGGGAAVSFVRAQITSGDVVPGAQASWTPMTGLTLAIPAAAGDQLTISMSALLNQTSSDFFELVVVVGGSIVRYSSTNSSSPSAANEGDPSIYPLSGAAIRATTASWNFVATAGDISGGNVTFALAFRGSGSGKAFASTNYPFRWWARNDRAGAVGSTIPGIMRSGSRYAPVFTTFAPPTVVLNEIRHVPIDFYSACTITELACEVTAAVTNAMVRLLVSKAGSNGRPSGNYLYVSPQLVASAVGKVGTGAISVSIAQPGRYFFAALPQVAVPTLRSIGQVPAMYEQASMATYNRCCYSEYGVSGAPVTVGGLSIDAGDAPRVECLIG